MSLYLSSFASRVLKDLFSGVFPDNVNTYSDEESLEIVKMFDYVGTWPEQVSPEDMFRQDNNNNTHLSYFVEKHPDCIDVVEFIQEDPGNTVATEILVELAIKQMDDHSDPVIQRQRISDFKLLAEKFNLSKLILEADCACNKWADKFKEIERPRQEKHVNLINEARELLKNPNTAWKARNLVKLHLNDIGSIGDSAREISNAADAFD